MAEIVIAGGGVSGLTAGIYALKNGFETVIVERHRTAGGNLTGWKREGYEIDNCVHWLTGTNPSTQTYKLWRETGAITENTAIYTADAFYTYKRGDKTVSLGKDLYKTKRDMLTLAPEDKREIKRFISAVENMWKICDLCGKNHDEKAGFFGKLSSGAGLLRYLSLTIEELSEKFKNETLRSAIGGYIGGPFAAIGLICAYAHFTAENGGVVEGGSLEMSKRMVQKYLTLGGKLILNSAVTGVDVSGSKIKGVFLDNGEELRGDYFVFASDIRTTYGEILKMPYPKFVKDGLSDFRTPVFSSFHTALEISSNVLPFEDETVIKTFGLYEKLLGKTFALRTYPYIKANNKENATLVQTMSFVCGNYAERWIALRKKDRAAYNRKKELVAGAVVKTIEKEFPVLKGKIRIIDVWTPATYNRYTGEPSGAYMSFILPSHAVPVGKPQRIKGISNACVASQWLKAPGGLPIAAEQGYGAAERIKSYFSKQDFKRIRKVSRITVTE